MSLISFFKIKYFCLIIICCIFTGCTVTNITIGDKRFMTYRLLDWTKVGSMEITYTNTSIKISNYEADREKIIKDLAPLLESAVQGYIEAKKPF